MFSQNTGGMYHFPRVNNTDRSQQSDSKEEPGSGTKKGSKQVVRDLKLL